MSVFVLRAKVNVGYDSYDGFVIRAGDEMEARSIAHNNGADEKRDHDGFWLDDKYSSCELIENAGYIDRGWKKEKADGIILGSFNAG